MRWYLSEDKIETIETTAKLKRLMNNKYKIIIIIIIIINIKFKSHSS